MLSHCSAAPLPAKYISRKYVATLSSVVYFKAGNGAYHGLQELSVCL